MEYCQLQKQLQLINISSELKDFSSLDLYNELDCIQTPKMKDFEIRTSDRNYLLTNVKRIAQNKGFKVILTQ